MISEKHESLIKEALKDWKDGKLTELSTLVVIDSIINPVLPGLEDIIWAVWGSFMEQQHKIRKEM